MSKQVIAVIGGTGAQGGGVVEALLANGNYAVRVPSRNPESDAAKALSARGVHVVKADLLDDKSLGAVFEGAYGAFIVTNFWDPRQMQKEAEVGSAAVKATSGTSGSSGTDGGNKNDATSDAAVPGAGPSAACAATITAFTPCGGTIPQGMYTVSSICSASTTSQRSPVCGANKGTTNFYYEGLLGLGQLNVGAGSLEFTSVRATGHYTSLGPQNCFPNNETCKFAKTALYGTGPTGDCTPQGTDCACAWTAQPMSQGTGSSAFTTSGNNLTWFGKTIPYCVSGTTLMLDLAQVYSTEAIPPGTPFLATFAKN